MFGFHLCFFIEVIIVSDKCIFIHTNVQPNLVPFLFRDYDTPFPYTQPNTRLPIHIDKSLF